MIGEGKNISRRRLSSSAAYQFRRRVTPPCASTSRTLYCLSLLSVLLKASVLVTVACSPL